MRRRVRQLLNAAKEAKRTEWQIRAAIILLSVNGLENALGYVMGTFLGSWSRK